jgi:uncharacterized membrane protein
MKQIILEKIKSWPLWLGIAALIAWATKTIWGVNLDKEINDFMSLLFVVVAGFGVVNNPNSRKTV